MDIWVTESGIAGFWCAKMYLGTRPTATKDDSQNYRRLLKDKMFIRIEDIVLDCWTDQQKIMEKAEKRIPNNNKYPSITK